MLTPDQITAFRTNGYLVVEDVLGPDVLDPVRADYAQLLDDLVEGWVAKDALNIALSAGFEDKLIAAYAAGCDWFQPMDISLPGEQITPDTPMHFSKPVFDMITSKRLLDLVEDLIGPEITSNPIQHVRIKPPATLLRDDEARAHVTATDWHQDRAVALEEADQTDMVTIWIAITDATLENGCLQVIPRVNEMLPHCPQRQTAIAPGLIDHARALPLPVRAGGIVVLDPMIPHSSLSNHTDGIRWSFDLRFNRTGQPTGRSHFPDFVARSRADPGSVLRDWSAWRTSWEDARARLSATPHIDIHRWASDAPYCA